MTRRAPRETDTFAQRALLLLLGATASGKTAVALALAGSVPLEIVSADSRQVYRGLDVGTAKPSIEERRRVAHHMIDVADPDDVMTAGRYAREARAAVCGIAAREREALVVGGAGLYVRALLGGLAPHLPRDPAVRARLEREADATGLDALHARLAARDPDAAQRIARRDRVRIVRALEVIEIAGRPITEIHREGRRRPPVAHAVYLERGAADLAARIDARAAQMVANGLLDETRRVLHRWPGARPLLQKTVGYAEALAVLDAAAPEDGLAERIARATRQYARRQRIWFQRLPELVKVPVAPDEPPKATATAVLNAFRRASPLTRI